MIILLIIDRYDSVMWGLCLDAKQESVWTIDCTCPLSVCYPARVESSDKWCHHTQPDTDWHHWVPAWLTDSPNYDRGDG